MKFFKKIFSWFKSHPELSGDQTVVEPIEVEPDPYTKAQKLLRCSTSCTGLDCSHHYDPDRIVEHVVTLTDGTNLLITGKEFVEGPPYYVEGEPILASEIWEVEGSNAMDVSSSKASRYVVDDLPDSADEGAPIWVEGKDPYLIGSVPDEVIVPPGKKYSALGNGFIDDLSIGTPVKVNKIREFTETRSIGTVSDNITQLIQGDLTPPTEHSNPFGSRGIVEGPLFAVEEAELIAPKDEYDQSDPLFITDIAEENDGN